MTLLTFSETWEIFRPLYGDINELEELEALRPTLAHYTSLNTIESILKSNQIWLSNPMFMNDFEEFRFGMNEALESVDRSEIFKDFPRLQSIVPEIVRNYNKLYDSYDDKLALDVYILSLSLHDPADNDGRLSMWRGYGAAGNGACIVFDTENVVTSEHGPFILGRVHYGTRSDRIEKLRGYLRQFCEILNSQELERIDLWHATDQLFDRIRLFALFTKHLGFKEEEEWRVVYIPENDIDNKYKGMIDYHLGQFGLEPKLKLDLNVLPVVDPTKKFLEQVVTKLIVGPSISSPHSLDLIKRMAKKHGHEYLDTKFVASQIPFRHRTLIA